jgi:glucose/arabinose dehydrogenase
MTPRALAAVCLVAALVAAACGDDGPAATEPGTTAPAPTAPAPTAPAPTTPGTTTVPTPAPRPPGEVRVRLDQIATADAPTSFVVAPATGQAYIVERGGRVRPLDLGSRSLGAAILDVSSDVTTTGERGLFDAVFTPDGRLVVSRTDERGDSRIEEYTIRDGRVDGTSRRTILTVDQPAANHNGGDIELGPDGMLWYGLGDGGGGGDPFGNGQNRDTLLGAVLRIDITDRGDEPYAIPPDNPFAGGGGRPEIWLYGVRNPWRFTFDRETGDLWIADVGQNTVEEINLLPAPERGRGANLQWPLREGFRRYAGDPPPDSVPPIFEYSISGRACAVTGGYVYRGRAIPALRGAYVYSDFCDGTIRALFTGPDGIESSSLGVDGGAVVSFGEDPDGELYVVALGGAVSRIVPA